MVNIDKLNSSINKLDIKSKEIENIIEKQQKISVLADEINELKNNIMKSSEEVVLSLKQIDKLLDKSENTAINIEKIVNEKINNILSIIDKYNVNINKLSTIIDKVEENSKEFNTDTLKKLNDIKNENYRLSGEIQNIIETKNSLLKSEIELAMKDLSNEIKNNNKEKEEFVSIKFKKVIIEQRVAFIVTVLILIILTIIK